MAASFLPQFGNEEERLQCIPLKIHMIQSCDYTLNRQFPLWDLPTRNHGGCVYHNKIIYYCKWFFTGTSHGRNWPFAGSMKLTELLMFLPKYPKKILFNMNKTNETFILLQIMTAMFYQLFIAIRKTQSHLTKTNFSKTLKINSKNSVYK